MSHNIFETRIQEQPTYMHGLWYVQGLKGNKEIPKFTSSDKTGQGSIQDSGQSWIRLSWLWTLNINIHEQHSPALPLPLLHVTFFYGLQTYKLHVNCNGEFLFNSTHRTRWALSIELRLQRGMETGTKKCRYWGFSARVVHACAFVNCGGAPCSSIYNLHAQIDAFSSKTRCELLRQLLKLKF